MLGYFWVSVKCLLTYKISYTKIAVRIHLTNFFEVENIFVRIYKGEGLGFLKE